MRNGDPKIDAIQERLPHLSHETIQQVIQIWNEINSIGQY